ncbi:hypothetical protein DXT35_13065 [Enterococcus faecalis]|jgi:hypothetical protein|nr:hypothetical protein HMPREF9499_02680 [Enterococcus faecalis TX0012]EGO2660625.1 hypothetical protein [Enterococcus faecalis]EJV38444.1 hypothetical protein HMPREF1344_01273 [Enterococcus faecalis R508]EPH71471.1 hypothetical protein D930_00115 [Enterococcus faecalis KI-6-1-110608-1]EGO8362652.1 hypothetical protein [Enterococcus faecalis]
MDIVKMTMDYFLLRIQISKNYVVALDFEYGVLANVSDGYKFRFRKWNKYRNNFERYAPS